MRIVDGIPYYKSRAAAHRAGKRESKRLKTMSYLVWRWGDEYGLITTDAQRDGRTLDGCRQYFTYNNLEQEAK